MTQIDTLPPPPDYDVVIVGGGPVGLLLAYQLTRFGVTATVLEQYPKDTQDSFGRAIALFPRTSEQLDQLHLIEPMLQLAFACRTSVTYKDGERVLPGRVWTFMESIKDTTYDFVVVLRQMYTEGILREFLGSLGVKYRQSCECVGFEVEKGADEGVRSMWVDKVSGREFALRSKYIIGADGGRSFVRRHAGIPFEGDTSEDKWIRIDGLVETDMPLNRSYGAIESKTHGNVLWAPLDHAATRIGFAYSEEVAKKYPDGVTEEVAVKEAIECMKPFKLEFKEVHWWTLYTIGQRIAQTFASHSNRVLLCGDAAHTHSSGAAQGLNTGIHDAVNLAWKLALTVRGNAAPGVLDTYTVERSSAVRRLLDYDKDIAILMSHKWPAWYKGDPDADPYLVLGEIFEQAATFNTGLGISYAENLLNQPAKGVQLTVVPGSRPPDVELARPGTMEKVRFQRVTRNFGKFYVVVFTGDVHKTKEALLSLETYLQSGEGAVLKTSKAVGWLTVSAATGYSPYEALGMKPFGDAYFDAAKLAHEKIGVDMEKGAVLILRPDGLVGSAGPLDGDFVRKYFSKVLKL